MKRHSLKKEKREKPKIPDPITPVQLPLCQWDLDPKRRCSPEVQAKCTRLREEITKKIGFMVTKFNVKIRDIVIEDPIRQRVIPTEEFFRKHTDRLVKDVRALRTKNKVDYKRQLVNLKMKAAGFMHVKDEKKVLERGRKTLKLKEISDTDITAMIDSSVFIVPKIPEAIPFKVDMARIRADLMTKIRPELFVMLRAVADGKKDWTDKLTLRMTAYTLELGEATVKNLVY